LLKIEREKSRTDENMNKIEELERLELEMLAKLKET